MYSSQIARYERIRGRTEAKLRDRRDELGKLDREALVRLLTREALDEEFEDIITANYEWDAVERIVRRAVEAV